jgi:eukaryotic-like serine/threonine-protein kinase
MSPTVGDLAGRSVDFGEARYVLDRLLSVGGMGEVYLARRVVVGGLVEWSTSELAAIKVVRRDVAHLAGNARSFAEEIRLHRALSHPNIVAVRGVTEEQGILCMLMDYLAGDDLREILRKARDQGRRLSEGAACTIVAQVADALDYVHRARGEDGQPLRIVHRDVSPSNIRITVPGEVKLMDFGVATCEAEWREETSPSWTGFKGKLAYLSPEQVKHEPLDGRSDLFALGAVLVECLTGKPLFHGHDLLVLQAIESVSPELVGAALGGVPEELQAICHRLLARDREARYTTGKEVAAALREYAFGRKRYLLDSRTLAYEIAAIERREVERYAELVDGPRATAPPRPSRRSRGRSARLLRSVARLLGMAILSLADRTPSTPSPTEHSSGAGRTSPVAQSNARTTPSSPERSPGTARVTPPG